MNLTEVTLLTATAAVDSVPSVRRPGGIATVTIAENDNARGVVEFAEELVGRSVSKNCAKVDRKHTTICILECLRKIG